MVATQAEKASHKVLRRGTRACRECKFMAVLGMTHSDISEQVAAVRSDVSTMRRRQMTYVKNVESIRDNGIKLKVTQVESAVQRIAREQSVEASPAAFTNATDSVDEIERLQDELKRSSPLFSLFNNNLFQEHDTQDLYPMEMSTKVQFADSSLSDREKLLSTISAVPTINNVLEVAASWWISWRDQHFALRKLARNMSLSTFVNDKLSSDNPVTVAVGLLALAMALRYLRSGIDDVSFNLPIPSNQLMDRIVAAVDQVVLDVPTYRGEQEMVLMLMLRAKMHVEVNQLRKSWFRIRTAIQVADEQGLGKPPPEGIEVSQEEAEQQRFIGSVYELDRLMSMVLGFPYAPNPSFTDARAFHILFNPPDDAHIMMRALRRITAVAAGLINDRNAKNDNDFSMTDSIQSSLDLAAAAMPLGWWDLMSQPILDSAQERHESLMTQMWFWTVQAYLHIPYLLADSDCAAKDLHRARCMEGARQLIRVFNFLRNEPSLSLYMCNCDDFQGLVGAVILLVGVIQNASRLAEDSAVCSRLAVQADVEYDMALVEDMRDVFRYRMFQQGGGMGKQALTVLDALSSYLYEDEDEDDNGQTSSSKPRTIMLPYFGTINIELTKRVPRLRSPSVRYPEAIVTSKLPTPPMSSNGHAEDDKLYYDVSTIVPTPIGQFNVQAQYLAPSQIDWNQWDHFTSGGELNQEWNPQLMMGDMYAAGGY